MGAGVEKGVKESTTTKYLRYTLTDTNTKKSKRASKRVVLQ